MDFRERFQALGEPMASGLFEEEDRSLFYRKALALRRYYENVPPPAYTGALLYPSGVLPRAYRVVPGYLNGFQADLAALRQADRELTEAFLQTDFYRYHSHVPREHTVAGNMYTHSMPNYRRILAEGLDAYEARVRAMRDREMSAALLHVLAGLRQYHGRCLAYLREQNAPQELILALEQVPFGPAHTIYEAFLAWNWALYLDNCDNLGDVAVGLAPYHHGEDVSALLDNLYRNLDENGGYSMQAGMAPSSLTIPCLAASHGRRRPMIELFVDEDTPDEVWDAALDDILSGSGSPSIYNRTLYRRGFLSRFPSIREEDLDHFCGGGCTESMLCGLSNVGSLDAGINLLLILEGCMKTELPRAASFEAFYEAYLGEIRRVSLDVMEKIAASQAERALYDPLPMRTLLVDDCIEKERDFNDDGARYSWSIISFAGIINVIDSLAVIRDMVFSDRLYRPEEFLRLLESGDPAFRQKLKNHPHRFGIDDGPTNALSYDLTHRVFGFLREKTPHYGLGFLPASIQFQSYCEAGKAIGATPCGRQAGEGLCDSLTAIFAKDTEGPTSLLKSVTALDLSSAVGTPVVNFTVTPKIDRSLLLSLIKGYLKLGGMQLQITCVSREMLEEAYREPEAHRNLIIRVGGYSEYFCRLSDALKRKVLERTQY